MPRKPRVEYPGGIYHVMSRANGKGNIFETDVDRLDFVKSLAETYIKADFQVHAYCLMRNHFHLVVETPNGNLVAGMKWFLSAYTLRFNHRNKRFGHVFRSRCGALIISEELKHRNWEEQDLVERAKRDPEKLAMAARLRKENTLTIPLIAKRLNMGSWKSFSAKLHQWTKTHKTSE